MNSMEDDDATQVPAVIQCGEVHLPPAVVDYWGEELIHRLNRHAGAPAETTE